MNVFLSCTKEKASSRCKAKDMYMPSSLFEKSYNYAKDILKADHIYILSAKYHLLGLNEEIEPYNETLNDASVEERKEWTEEVLKQMKSRHIDFDAKTYFLCGENYIEYLEEYFKDSKSLYKGKGIGEIMHWLDRKLGNKTNESLKEYLMENLNQSWLETFLNKFPKDASSWKQATDEIRVIATRSAEYLKEFDNIDIELVNYKDIKSPSEWNTTYSNTIKDNLEKMSKSTKSRFLNDIKKNFS